MGEPYFAGFPDFGRQGGKGISLQEPLHHVGLVNGSIHCFLEIGGFAVHLAVHPVSHVFHHPHAFKVQVALAGAYDLEKFGHFVSVFDIDDVIVLPVGHTGVHAEEGHGFDDFFCKPQGLGHHFQMVVALGTAD